MTFPSNVQNQESEQLVEDPFFLQSEEMKGKVIDVLEMKIL